jgi:hypothetical protein
VWLADPGLPVGWNDVVVSSVSCIFCLASASTTKITKEDVLSTWIDDVLTTAVTGGTAVVRTDRGGADWSEVPEQLAGVLARRDQGPGGLRDLQQRLDVRL